MIDLATSAMRASQVSAASMSPACRTKWPPTTWTTSRDESGLGQLVNDGAVAVDCWLNLGLFLFNFEKRLDFWRNKTCFSLQKPTTEKRGAVRLFR